MNTKHIFNDKDWIVTSGEIEITPLHGTRPMHPALSKKLYNQNMQSHMQHKKPSVWWQIPLNAIGVNVTTINKYTIVELTHNNKHYHGLASRADCDKENAVTGIAVAYHRAFKKMMDDIKDDDDLSPIGKAYFKNKDWVSYDLPCKLNKIWGTKKFEASTYRECIDKQLKDTVDKQSKLVDKAISDLLACTYIDLKQYDLKTVHGAKAAIKEISKYGYKIYELQNPDPLILTYVLQRCGVEITKRDIKLTLPTSVFDKTQGSSPNEIVEDYTPCWYINNPPSDKKLTELIHEAINGLKNNGNEPAEIRIKPVAFKKLRKEHDIQHEWFNGERFIDGGVYLGLKYIIDPSIDVDIIIN